MRFIITILVGVSLLSCKDEVGSSSEKKADKILSSGEWRLVDSEHSFYRFQEGIKFSEDRQVFYIDSQGRTVAPLHEIIYSLSGDTLKIVDYKYEQRFLFSKGTDILIIEELTENEMILNAIHPEGPNKLIFENIK